MRRQGSPDRSLEALFSPRSVAIVGASDDPAKWGHIIAARALSSRGDRTVLLVNRRAGQVLGQPAHPSAEAAAAARGLRVDLAVLCVPAAGFVASVSDAVAAGARAIVGITAGLSESGEEGGRVEAEALAIARAAGAVLVGPNCLGVVDTTTGLQLAHAELPPGDVAVLSQSGNLVLDLAGLLADRGLGISRFVSLGNQADLGLVDFLLACLDHDGTRAVAVYAEDVVDGRAFLDAARALRDAGKPLVLLAPGRTEAAVRSAASHTGSLTTSSMVVDAACAASGARRVDHPTQMADLLAALRSPRRLTGRRAVVLTDGGGHGAIAADALAAAGLQTPVLTGALTTELGGALSARATVTNPVDLAGAGEEDVDRYAGALEILLASDQVDGVLLTGYFGGYSAHQSGLSEPELAAARRMGEVVGAQESRSSCRRSTRTARRARCYARRASLCIATSTARARCSPAWSSRTRPVSPSRCRPLRNRSPTRRTERPERVSPRQVWPFPPPRRSRIGRTWRLRSPACASLSCSRRPAACTSPMTGAWSSVLSTSTRRGRRTTTWWRGWRHPPSSSRRWRRSTVGSS